MNKQTRNCHNHTHFFFFSLSVCYFTNNAFSFLIHFCWAQMYWSITINYICVFFFLFCSFGKYGPKAIMPTKRVFFFKTNYMKWMHTMNLVNVLKQLFKNHVARTLPSEHRNNGKITRALRALKTATNTCSRKRRRNACRTLTHGFFCCWYGRMLVRFTNTNTCRAVKPKCHNSQFFFSLHLTTWSFNFEQFHVYWWTTEILDAFICLVQCSWHIWRMLKM